jgi:uncharacterized RDD family membrane protein YckC
MEDQLLDTDLQTTPPQYKDYAGFWERFGAAFIDGLILFVVGQLVMGAFGINFMDLFQSASKGDDPIELFGNKYYMASIVSLLINWYYFAQQESSEHQATLGKRAIGLVVTDLNGQRLSFQQASLRFLMKQIISIISLVGSLLNSPNLVSALSGLALIGYIIQPFTPRKQAFHDIIAKTLVYHK